MTTEHPNVRGIVFACVEHVPYCVDLASIPCPHCELAALKELHLATESLVSCLSALPDGRLTCEVDAAEELERVRQALRASLARF